MCRKVACDSSACTSSDLRWPARVSFDLSNCVRIISTAHALFLRSCATVMDTTVTLRLRLCPWMYSTLDKPYACASLRPQPLTLDATHTHCEQVLQGEHVVKAIETVGSASGAPSSAVRIRDCGVV